MLFKSPMGKSRFYDLIHRGAVYFCFTVTTFGTVALAFVHFYANRKKGAETQNKKLEVTETEIQ